MKKTLFLRAMALLLTLSTLAGCFTACRGGDAPADTGTDPSTEGQTTGITTSEGTAGASDAEYGASKGSAVYLQISIALKAAEGGGAYDRKVGGGIARSNEGSAVDDHAHVADKAHGLSVIVAVITAAHTAPGTAVNGDGIIIK